MQSLSSWWENHAYSLTIKFYFIKKINNVNNNFKLNWIGLCHEIRLNK